MFVSPDSLVNIAKKIFEIHEWISSIRSHLKAIKQNSKISWEHTPDITPEDKNIWMAFSVIPKTKTGQFPSRNDSTVKKEFPWLSSPPQMDLLQKPNHETQKWISSHSFLALGLVPVNHVWAIPWTVPNRSRLPWRARRTMLKNKWPAKPKRPRARGQKWRAPTTGPLWEIESQWKTQWPYEISFSLLVEKVDLHALTQVEKWGSAATRVEGKHIRFEDVCGWVWCFSVHLEKPNQSGGCERCEIF